MDEYIAKTALYGEVAKLEELARNGYLETPIISPAYTRYTAQMQDMTAFKHLIADFPAADVEPVQEWIPVNDMMPEVGGYVVCIAKRNPFSRFMPMVARIEKNGWVNPITEQYISEVTHWMSISVPPKGE